jgi:hypothetical protein
LHLDFDGSSQLDAERTGFEAEGKSDEVVTFEMIA